MIYHAGTHLKNSYGDKSQDVLKQVTLQGSTCQLTEFTFGMKTFGTEKDS